MTTCIDPATWLAAQAACRATQAVSGLGVMRSPYSSVGDVNDIYTAPPQAPCDVIKTPACPSITCPAGTTKLCIMARPGEASPGCTCNYPAPQPKPRPLTAAPPNPNASSTVQQASITAGFSHWGILAAVLVGGVIVYKVATR